ncbi:MAG: DUF6625 family protein [Lacipirellulaceae bacterium]
MTEGSPRVCLVVCHFGPLPPWWGLFLLTCGANATIDFLVLTDQPSAIEPPPNVRLVSYSTQSLAADASRLLGRAVAVDAPYKACDYKPMYGELFQGLLGAYDYWGYTDLDVVFGDLRAFLTANDLGASDVLTARREYLVGHFTLFRNTLKFRRLFWESAHVPALFLTPKVASFDECGYQWQRLIDGHPPDHRAACDSMTHVVFRLHSDGALQAVCRPLAAEHIDLDPDWRLRWKDGTLVDDRTSKPWMYLHFRVYKNRPGFQMINVLPDDRELLITPDGVVPVRG